MMIEKERILSYIEQYKSILEKNGGLKGCGELYKWKLLAKYEGRPNLAKQNLETEFEEIKFSNLVYQRAYPVMKEFAKQRTEEYREILSNLFDENVNVDERIRRFIIDTNLLYRAMNGENQHKTYHDERTAATLLTYHNPHKYTFFKTGVYSEFCKISNVEPRKMGRYGHYLEMIKEISSFIEYDKELIDVIASQTIDLIQTPILIAQDIVYNFFGKSETLKVSVSDDGVYDCDIEISINEWELILKDPNITKDTVKNCLVKFYSQPDHKSSCKALGDIYDIPPQSFIGTITAFSKAVQKKLNRFHIKWVDGKDTYWIIPMRGRYIKNNLFEWQLREELVTAMENLGLTTLKNYSEQKEISDIFENENNIIEENHNPIVSLIKAKKQIILQGAPGTGKTYKTAELAVAICNPSFNQQADRAALMDEYNRLKTNGQIAFTTFHQSMDYEEFVEGLKPSNESESMKFEPQSGLFKRISDRALLNTIKLSPKNHSATKRSKEECDVDMKNMSRDEKERIVQDFLATPKSERVTVERADNFVLIIDEINRGNISKILGELITLLENDKRTGECNELMIRLPYSHTQFSVPSNLYIIGTMNTADRSVGYIDYAIRRRFAFVTLSADGDAIDSFYKDEALKAYAQTLFERVMELIHDNIAFDFNADDIMVGHSYFMVRSEDELNQNLEYGIKPLLREYAIDGIINLEREKGGRYTLIEGLTYFE